MHPTQVSVSNYFQWFLPYIEGIVIDILVQIPGLCVGGHI